MTNNAAMPRTASEIVRALEGTNAAARFFGVRPPSVSGWLRVDAIPDERLMPIAAELEAQTKGWFSRATQWPDRWQRIWPELAASQKQQVDEEGAHA